MRENSPGDELVRFVKLLLHSEFFRDLFAVLTGKENEEDLINLFLLSWEEETLKGKSFKDYIHLIIPIIMTISKIGFAIGCESEEFKTSEDGMIKETIHWN